MCTVCRSLKTGKKYIYASSDRKSKLEVCKDCHKAKLETLNKQANSVLGDSFTLGVLKPKDTE